MKIGIIGPTESEIRPVIKAMKHEKTTTAAMLDFHEGTLEHIAVVALSCGICKVNAAIAAQVLIDRFEVTHIIVAGVAGGMDKMLEIGDTVIAEEVAYHDVDDIILTKYHPFLEDSCFRSDKKMLITLKKAIQGKEFKQKVHFGKIVTGEAFITESGRDEIISKYNPLCVDMETGAVAQVCHANVIPFIAIRSITDTENESGMETFEENCARVSLHTFSVLKTFLEALSLCE